jgi:hypothetical protein
VIDVVIVSGDRDEGGYKSTTAGYDDWAFIPFSDIDARKGLIEQHIPCTGYPTPGVINAKTGAVIEADAWGKVDEANFQKWLSQC